MGNYTWNEKEPQKKIQQQEVKKPRHSVSGVLAVIFLIFSIALFYTSVAISISNPEKLGSLPLAAAFCVIVTIVCFILSNKRLKKQSNTPKADKPPVYNYQESNNSGSSQGKIHNQTEFYEVQRLKREIQVIEESIDIAENTQNLETFCSRYTLYMDKARKLYTESTNGTINLDLFDPRELCMAIIKSADTMRRAKLSQFEDTQLAAAEELKTTSGKLNRYKALYESLAQAKSVFDGMPEYDSLVGIIDMHIALLEGEGLFK